MVKLVSYATFLRFISCHSLKVGGMQYWKSVTSKVEDEIINQRTSLATRI